MTREEEMFREIMGDDGFEEILNNILDHQEEPWLKEILEENEEQS